MFHGGPVKEQFSQSNYHRLPYWKSWGSKNKSIRYEALVEEVQETDSTEFIKYQTLVSSDRNLRWLNTVLPAISGNSRAGVCFKLDKQTWRPKNHGTQKRISQNLLLKFCDIWQNFYFYRILNTENFKMEVEHTNLVTHFVITVQLYYWLSKYPSVKIWS